MKCKLTELINAIKNNTFPIIIKGPSSSGKTLLIKKALSILNLKYKYVDSTSIINKPLDNRIIHTVLNCIKDIENLKYNRIIIETSINAENSFKNVKVIQMKNENKMDFYRFLGRIFYKKMKIEEIECEEDGIIYYCNDIKGYGLLERGGRSGGLLERGSGMGGGGSNRCGRSGGLEVYGLKGSDRSGGLEVYGLKGSDRSGIIRNKDQIKEETDQLNNKRRFLINEIDSDSIINESLSFSDDFVFSEDNFNEENYNLNPVFKKFSKILCNTKTTNKKSSNLFHFDLNKIESYIYANFINFVDLKDALTILDSISLLDSNRKIKQMYFVILIESILKSKENKKGFKSFKSGFTLA